jgi:hypothetical protein
VIVGNEEIKTARSLQRGTRQACKICQDQLNRARRKTPQERLLKRLYSHLKSGAKYRKIEFHLTFDQAVALVNSKCYYCGIDGGRIYQHPQVGSIRVNGIDRSDSSLPYQMNNVVPCCPTCNYMKNTLSFDNFIFHIKSILLHLEDKK